MMRWPALRHFTDRAAPELSDWASPATTAKSEIIGLSTLGVAMLALVYAWAGALLKGSAVLAVLLWVGATVSRQFGRDPRAHISSGDKVRALTRGVPLVILGLVVASLLGPAYLILAALIGVAGTIALRLMTLKGSAGLAVLLWLGATVSRQFGRDPRAHISSGDKVRALTRGALRRSLLVALVILGLFVASSLSPVYLILVALIGAGGTIVLRLLTAVVRAAAVGRLDPAHRPRVARASGVVRVPIARAKPWLIRLPKLIDTRCDTGPEPEEPVELHISFVILRHSDQDEAARLAIQAVTGMSQAEATPAPTCLRRQPADGGAILDLRFHVRNVRRGSEHVLDEAESRLWDLLHEHRIPYALRPRRAMSHEAILCEHAEMRV